MSALVNLPCTSIWVCDIIGLCPAIAAWTPPAIPKGVPGSGIVTIIGSLALHQAYLPPSGKMCSKVKQDTLNRLGVVHQEIYIYFILPNLNILPQITMVEVKQTNSPASEPKAADPEFASVYQLLSTHIYLKARRS
ncbi:uncharacterized protein CIMG_13290 [Coccidioides immitis RS]|uniref:Uncharacterized protein n=1 Tax=Coccidioides immitis (strain RS) TaxID=246410 RepID=J3K4B9_COCIM|nr:uncharacterized protein CIMG_13290 [Coccidioides immitis RS]EAS29134.3 hypothetical protein CIMG_13290 [Coccidioides immitis RS]